MNFLDCCLSAKVKSNFEQWLVPETEELNLWDVKLRLYRCPSCATLWVWRSQSRGHQDWNQELRKIADHATFNSILVEEEKAKEERLAKLRVTYELNGWEWKW